MEFCNYVEGIVFLKMIAGLPKLHVELLIEKSDYFVKFFFLQSHAHVDDGSRVRFIAFFGYKKHIRCHKVDCKLRMTAGEHAGYALQQKRMTKRLNGFSHVVVEGPQSGSTRTAYRGGLMRSRKEIVVLK